MTIDKSLKTKGRLVRSRNVLKRHERIEQMQKEDKWGEGRSPLGLPKTRVMKSALGKKKKKAKAEEEGAAAAPAAAGKAAAKPAAKK
jgi:small basic protein (TIGR04137 family)